MCCIKFLVAQFPGRTISLSPDVISLQHLHNSGVELAKSAFHMGLDKFQLPKAVKLHAGDLGTTFEADDHEDDEEDGAAGNNIVKEYTYCISKR